MAHWAAPLGLDRRMLGVIALTHSRSEVSWV